jgi:FdhE protein
MERAELVAVEPWTERRERAAVLLERYPFAAELLRLYGALVDVQERAFVAARSDEPEPAELAPYVVQHVLRQVVDATIAHGPKELGVAAQERLDAGHLDDLVAEWLRGEEQSDIDRYLGRAASAPVLEALGERAGLACRGARDDHQGRGRHCPVCGSLPQLAYFEATGDDLVTAPRRLLCARCAHAWIFPRLTCAGCGETAADRLIVYAETERFPHLRVDACASCRRYLLTVDLRKAPDAVPIVDELAALPRDLHAQDHSLSKIMVNMMGIG